MGTCLPSLPLRDQLSNARPQRINILIADETLMVCDLLRSALKHARLGFDVVACATSRAEIIKYMNTRSVEVVLISESLNDGQFAGFQALADLRKSFPSARVIALLKSASRDFVLAAFRAGAKGVFCKAEPIQALCKCIRAVYAGQIWANSTQLNLILEALVNATPIQITNVKGRQLLAQREEEVANLVADGLSNRDIARKLDLSEHTISNYLFRIYEKLGLSSRVELVLYVVRYKRLREQ
jgi:DNA-binding NarL/FixJ family response regulator